MCFFWPLHVLSFQFLRRYMTSQVIWPSMKEPMSPLLAWPLGNQSLPFLGGTSPHQVKQRYISVVCAAVQYFPVTSLVQNLRVYLYFLHVSHEVSGMLIFILNLYNWRHCSSQKLNKWTVSVRAQNRIYVS